MNKPANITEPVMYVRHSELTRSSDESPYRSVCPKCNEGTLLVNRNQTTFQLMRIDCCTLCGQTVCYQDVTINTESLKDLPTVVGDKK